MASASETPIALMTELPGKTQVTVVLKKVGMGTDVASDQEPATRSQRPGASDQRPNLH